MTGGETVTLLVDTGADISLFKRTKISPRQPVNRADNIKIQGVTDGLTYSIGRTETQLYIDDFTLNHTFHIVENNFPIPSDGILGRDFITKYKCKLARVFKIT